MYLLSLLLIVLNGIEIFGEEAAVPLNFLLIVLNGIEICALGEADRGGGAFNRTKWN